MSEGRQAGKYAAAPANGQLLKSLYKKYHRTVLDFLGRKSLTRETAEDIVQDAYYRISRLENPQDIEHPKAYLFRTVKNIMLNEARRKTNRDDKKHVPFDDDMHGAAGLSPHAELEARQQLKTFENALQRLPEKHRDVFILQRFEGLSYSQIAELQGIGISTVGKYLTRAIAQVRADMENENA